MIRILWPTDGFLTETEIKVMYADALANGELDHDAAPLNEVSMDPEYMARTLHEAGVITMGRW